MVYSVTPIPCFGRSRSPFAIQTISFTGIPFDKLSRTLVLALPPIPRLILTAMVSPSHQLRNGEENEPRRCAPGSTSSAGRALRAGEGGGRGKGGRAMTSADRRRKCSIALPTNVSARSLYWTTTPSSPCAAGGGRAGGRPVDMAESLPPEVRVGLTPPGLRSPGKRSFCPLVFRLTVCPLRPHSPRLLSLPHPPKWPSWKVEAARRGLAVGGRRTWVPMPRRAPARWATPPRGEPLRRSVRQCPHLSNGSL